MKVGLKTFLLDYLKAQGGKHIPHFQLMLLVKQKLYRESNAERRLREMPEIGKDLENGVIKAYYYKQPSQFEVEKWNSQFKRPEVKQPLKTLF